MSPKTIMVQLDVDAPATARLDAALELAGRFDAELVAFCAADIRIHLPYEGGRAVAEAQRQRHDEISTRMRGLREEFVDLAGDRAQTRWIGAIGHPTELLALHARSADLILVGTPESGVAIERDRRIDPGRLILSAGRPVLVLAGSEAPPRAERIVVAWKDAREARRAVVDAMPFLALAGRVVVATAVEGSEKQAREGLAAVMRHLARHGVSAEEHVLSQGSTSPGEAVADLAREIGADMVVSGGYGHSRIREWAFGGVTRSLIRDGALHRFFSN